MKYIASIFLMAVVSSYATLLSAQEVPDYLRQYQTNGFPKNDRSVRFEDHSRSFPPKPLGMVETTHPIEFRALTSSLITPERSRDTVQRLVAMPEVKRAIGNR